MKRKAMIFLTVLCFSLLLCPLSAFAADSGDITPDEEAVNTLFLNGEPEGEPGEGEQDPVAAESITLSDTALTMKAGDSHALTLTVLPENTTDKTALWETADPAVAEVDAGGVVTAAGLGKTVITVTVGECTASCTVTVNEFSDVPHNVYYYSDVYWALANGITKGTSNATFGPDVNCSRAMAITLIYRINGNPAVSGSVPFTDVNKNSFYYNALVWAYNNKIVTGVSATEFWPDGVCTRGQIITMIWRCKRQWPNGKANFSDVQSGSFFYYPVAWAAEKGITKGTTAATFSPGKYCSRAEIVTLLHRCDAGKNAVLNRSAWQLYYPKAEAILDRYGRDLRTAFNWSSSMRYYGHGKADMPDYPSPGSEWFADFGFTNSKGNCYVMAATFWEMAVCLGYDTRQMSGKVPLARGGLGPHSWVEINVYGSTYVCDPDFTYGTGRNGFLIHYGQSGTWRYSSYSPMNR